MADNTRLVYYKADKCDEKFMYFTHKDGVLTHSCSGKRVCPRGENRESILRLKETRRKHRLFYAVSNALFVTGGKVDWETPLVVSSTCPVNASKFQR